MAMDRMNENLDGPHLPGVHPSPFPFCASVDDEDDEDDNGGDNDLFICPLSISRQDLVSPLHPYTP